MSPLMQTPLFKFDHYLFDNTLGEITCNGEIFRLEHQQTELLLLLLKNKQKVVTRDQIAKEIWQGVIVEDNTISKAITRLRRVLKDNAKSPRFIKTIPKSGYQFIADVEEVTTITPTIVIKKTLSKTHLSIVITFLIIASITALLFVNYPKQEKQHFSNQQTTITYQEGLEQNAHLHPDGKQLLFIGRTDKGYAIFHKKIKGASVKLISHVNSRLSYPKWLASNNAFIYSQINTQGQCQILSTTIEHPEELIVLSTCLSNEPVEVYINSKTNNLIWQDSSGVWQFNLTSNLRQQLPFSHEHVNVQMPSPDYQFWATLTQNNGKSVLSIYNIKNQKLIYAKKLAYQITDFKWAHNSQALYHLSQHPAHQLIKQSFNDAEEVIASTSFGFFSQISDIQNKNTVEFVISSVDIDIIQATETKETIIVNSTFPDYNPSLSSDLSKLAFASKRTGSAQIWLKEANGEFQQLTNFKQASYIYTIAWSLDNNKLLVKRNNKLYIIDVKSKKTIELAIDTKNKVAWQWVSKNSIAYINNNTHSLFYFDIDNHNQKLAKTNVGYAQLVDQHWYISDTANNTLSYYDFTFNQSKNISQQLNGRFWLVNNQQLYLFSKKPNALMRINLDETESTVLKGSYVNHLSLKSGGNSQFIYHRVSQNEANIYQLHAN